MAKVIPATREQVDAWLRGLSDTVLAGYIDDNRKYWRAQSPGWRVSAYMDLCAERSRRAAETGAPFCLACEVQSENRSGKRRLRRKPLTLQQKVHKYVRAVLFRCHRHPNSGKQKTVFTPTEAAKLECACWQGLCRVAAHHGISL